MSHVSCLLTADLYSYSTVVCQMVQVRALLHCITCMLPTYRLCIKINMQYYFMIFTSTVTLTSSADSVCPKDTVVLTCVTDTGEATSIQTNLWTSIRYTSNSLNSYILLEDSLCGVFINCKVQVYMSDLELLAFNK